MTGRAADLIEIPESLWSHAEMVEALSERDIGRVFRLVSKYAGVSQTRLAIACSMTQPKISGIMRETARVETLEVFERIADGLDLPAAARLALGLAPRARHLPADNDATGPDWRRPASSHQRQSPRGSDPFSLTVMTSGTFGARSADAAAMQSFRSADLQVGGGHVYASVVTYLQADVGPRLFGDDSGDSPAVFTAAAALTEMAGWMAHDAGRDTDAQQHFGRSLSLAQVGGDHQLGAHVLGSMSHLASHLGQPDEAMALARRGQAVLQSAAPSPGLEARLLAMEARGRAGRREAGACAKLLARAETALSRPPDASRSPWVSQFDSGSLAGEAARCMSALRNWSEAGRQAEATVRLRPASRARSRAFGQLTLATALVAQGRPDEACPIAQEAIDSTKSLGSFLVIEQLLGLQHALRSYSQNKAVAEFLGRLEESLRNRLWLYQWLTRNAREFAVGREEIP
jgi:transcriptional regulator with XRE-family HTH domain